eukprot:2856650-Alexandrium_andersonii.AAC.1
MEGPWRWALSAECLRLSRADCSPLLRHVLHHGVGLQVQHAAGVAPAVLVDAWVVLPLHAQ